MIRLVRLLFSYWRTRRLRFATRAALEAYQARKLATFQRWLTRRSVYFAPFKHTRLSAWPMMDKATMIAHFDTMNTAGLTWRKAMDVAIAAENSRDFTPAIGKITVGLSSGTSGQRGIFAVREAEKARWAGVMLAKALPRGLFAGERVALFLRANSNLYTTVRSRWLAFEFFDLFAPFEHHMSRLHAYRPSVIVAPAQVLRKLALAALSGELQAISGRVISVAEVLEPQDRALIRRAFPDLHEIYQATEGFLASTCEHGVLHLNEEYVHIEPEWLDDARRRFVPIVTDFSRLTQPIVRYRLNDVLIARMEPCPCGRVTRALDGIEGRCDDLLKLVAPDGTAVTVFSDVVSRVLARSLPPAADYRLIQKSDAVLHLHAEADQDALETTRRHLEKIFLDAGADVSCLSWQLHASTPPFDPRAKRRRIIRESCTQ